MNLKLLLETVEMMILDQVVMVVVIQVIQIVPLEPLLRELNHQVMVAATQGEQEKDLLLILNTLKKERHQDHICQDKGFGTETILLN